MSSSSGSRRSLVIVLLLLLALLIVLAARCASPQEKAASQASRSTGPAAQRSGTSPTNSSASPTLSAERLSIATLKAPSEVVAGATFRVDWTGPNNSNDFLTIVPPSAPASHYENNELTSIGNPLTLAAPITTGAYEVRYVTERSRTVLAKAPLKVVAAAITLSAAASAGAGSRVSISWSGPNNAGDFITVVPRRLPDGDYGNNEITSTGSPLTVLVPVEPGEAEIRYLSGQGRVVLARRPFTIIAELASLDAPETVIAGKPIPVSWKGPNNRGDFITIVPKAKPDGQNGAYGLTSEGSSVTLSAPIEPGDAEIRYMTGQGYRVLARKPLLIQAAEVSLEASSSALTGAAVSISWQGPNNRGDYVTIVPKTTPDGSYGNYRETVQGSPLMVTAPKDAGSAEIRYISGQGNKVLARRAIDLHPALSRDH